MHGQTDRWENVRMNRQADMWMGTEKTTERCKDAFAPFSRKKKTILAWLGKSHKMQSCIVVRGCPSPCISPSIRMFIIYEKNSIRNKEFN